MNLVEYIQPDYLLCELPIKTGGMDDNRLWVYCRRALSLIEFVDVTNVLETNIEGTRFYYGSECYLAAWVQNNCAATDHDSDTVMRAAWDFLKNYIAWEDGQVLGGSMRAN